MWNVTWRIKKSSYRRPINQVTDQSAISLRCIVSRGIWNQWLFLVLGARCKYFYLLTNLNVDRPVWVIQSDFVDTSGCHTGRDQCLIAMALQHTDDMTLWLECSCVGDTIRPHTPWAGSFPRSTAPTLSGANSRRLNWTTRLKSSQ